MNGIMEKMKMRDTALFIISVITNLKDSFLNDLDSLDINHSYI